VIRGDRCAAGAWLRRAARDPSVHPWLLLDQLITREIDKCRLTFAGETGRELATSKNQDPAHG
jgi:hypothetical protein